MIPIIDAHHHIWRKTDLDWLSGPEQPRVFGPYKPIQRDYLIDEFREDLEGNGVVGSVYVQTNWPKGMEVEEARWVQAEGDESGWPMAIVGYVNFSDPASADTLKTLSGFPNMRGIRQQLHWHENPLYNFAPRPDLMNDADWLNNFARLQDYGWSFDLQVFASQMEDSANLAARFPETTFVLQHAGMLEDASSAAIRSDWREGMDRLAQQPNVVTKTSALGTFLNRNDAAHIADVLGETLEIFGAERCIFGSNFPIEKLWTDYGSLVDAHRAALNGLSESDQRAILHDNARRVYRLD